MPWVCLQFVIVVFPDQTHLLFLKEVESLHQDQQQSMLWGLRYPSQEWPFQKCFGALCTTYQSCPLRFFCINYCLHVSDDIKI